MIGIGVCKLTESAEVPSFETKLSAGYDIRACLWHDKIKFNGGKNHGGMDVMVPISNGKKYINLRPGDRVLVPTGLVFVIDEDYQMKVIPRSGIAWKDGLTVLNSPGTIDPDYFFETFIIVINSGYNYKRIFDGDRIAQVEFTKRESVNVKFTPLNINDVEYLQGCVDRKGGIGSTGKK